MYNWFCYTLQTPNSNTVNQLYSNKKIKCLEIVLRHAVNAETFKKNLQNLCKYESSIWATMHFLISCDIYYYILYIYTYTHTCIFAFCLRPRYKHRRHQMTLCLPSSQMRACARYRSPAPPCPKHPLRLILLTQMWLNSEQTSPPFPELS